MSTVVMPRAADSNVSSEALGENLPDVSRKMPWTDPDESAGEPAVVPGTHPQSRSGPVVVALDDDGNAGPLLRYGRRLAAWLGVPLRAAYVWSDCRPPECTHHRRCHRDLGEACRLLTALLDDHLSMETVGQVERDVLHAKDPAAALVTLSASASILVVGSSSDRPRNSAELGSTTRALLGRTRCPVLVVPCRTWSGPPVW